MYNSYRKSAFNKDRDFTLKIEEFEKLILGNCHYCGIKPNRPYKRDGKIREPLLFNGIDRKNNLEGYTIENSVTCCTECNFLKGHKDYESFIKLIKRIFLNLSRQAKKIKREQKNEKKEQL